MSQTEAKVTIHTCDAPGCGIETIAKNDALPEGYSGTVRWENETGGFSASWFAHTANHIRKAVTAVMNGDSEGAPDPALSAASTPAPSKD
jgi:hypothetical protein